MAARRVPLLRWAVVAAGIALVLLAIFLLPVGSLPRNLVARGVGVLAVVAYTWRMLRLPRAVSRVWFWMWLYLVFTVTADIFYDLLQAQTGEPPFPGPTDVLYLVTYVFALTAMWHLTALLSPERDVEAWIDTAILAIAAGSLVLTYIIGPLVMQAGHLDLTVIVSVSYPLLDVVVVAALARAVIMPGERNAALAALGLSMLLFLGFDLAYNAEALSWGWSEAPIMEVVWTLAIVLLALAPFLPGSEAFRAQPASTSDRVTPLRALTLALGVLVPSLLLRVAVYQDHLLVAKLLGPGGFVVVVLLILRAYRLLGKVQEQSRQLADLARTDSLTGLPNRRTWDHELVRAARHAHGYHEPLTIALLDLDHFKQYNDEHGHLAGDEYLVQSVRAWRETLGGVGTLARYGGEEFGLLLPHHDLERALPLLEELRAAMAPPGTVSIGATVLGEEESVETAVNRADLALYRAKAAGRDRVVIDPEPARA